jgi:hypothetical protein
MNRSRRISVNIGILLFCTAVTRLTGQSVNGTYYVGSGSGMYAHIADAVAAIGSSRSGTIILTAGYTDVISSTLNIGHLYGPGIKVFMLPGSTIQENITDGSAGIKVLEGSSLECLGAAASGSVNGVLSTCQVITGGSSANMASMVTTGALDMGRSQDVFGLQGITFEPGNATVTAVGDFEGITTPSLVANNNFFGGPNVTYVWHIGYGTGGGKIFVNNEVRGDSYVTGALVYISGGEAGFWNPTSPTIEGGEISCRGSGAASIKIDGDSTGSGEVAVIDAVFDHIWNQDCGGPTLVSPYISIHNASHVTFRDMSISTSTTVSPIISITENAPGLTDFVVFDNVEVICQSPNCSGQTNWISDTTAGGYTHTLPPVTVNRQKYGYFTYIAHDEAGNWPPQSVYRAPATGTTTNQMDTNLIVTQSGALGSTSYEDASDGYALRVQNQGAADLDFGVNGYSNSWIESHQEGVPLGKTLNINTKYGGWTFFGGEVFAPSFTLNNGDQVPAMPSTSAVTNHVTCILSAGPPIVLGHCTTNVKDDGSCKCN